MSDPAVQIPVNLDTKEAEKDARAFSGGLASNLVGMKAALDLAVQGLRLLGSAITAVVGPAQEAERAQRALTTALRQQTSDYQAYTTRLGAYNAALQESVGIDDDALAQLQSKLLLLGVLPSELDRATKATIGLAEITGEDLSSAGTKVSKVLAGNVEALSKLGIKGTDIADVLRKLDRGFEAAQGRAQTFEGRVNALSVAWGALKEEIGTAIITNPEVIGGLEDLRAWVKDITTAAENGRSPLGLFVSDVVGGLREIAEFARNRSEDLDRIRSTFAILSRTTLIGGMLRTGQGIIDFVGDRIEEANSAEAIRAGRAGSGAGAAGGARSTGARNVLAEAAGANAISFGIGVEFGTGEGSTIKGDKRATTRDALAAEREWQDMLADARRVARERQAEDAKLLLADTKRQNDAQLLAILHGTDVKTQAYYDGIDAKRLAMNEEARLNAEHTQQEEEFYEKLVRVGVGGVSQFIAGTISSLMQGKLDAGELVGQFFGTILSGVGQALVGLGTMQLIAAINSTPAPWMWGATGGPFAVAGGLAMIAGGSALMGVGQGVSALSSGAGGGAASAASRAASLPRTRAPSTTTAAPAGFVPSGSAPAAQVTNIYLSPRGFVSGTPRQVARDLTDLLMQAGLVVREA